MGYASEHGIKALCFDIDGTFYPKRDMLLRLGIASALHLPFALRYNAMRQRIRKEVGFTEGDCSSLEELQEKESGLMYPGRDASYFISKEERIFRRPWERLFSTIRPFDGLRETLEKAKGEGYILAALSDFPIGTKLIALGIEDLIDWAASTEDFGALKPSVRPFRMMLEALGVRPEEALYTGDSRSKDVDGAANAHMHTALIARRGEVYNKAGIVFSSWAEFGNLVL